MPTETHSEPSQTFKMELFATTVNGWKPWAIFAKNSILDISLSFKYSSFRGALKNLNLLRKITFYRRYFLENFSNVFRKFPKEPLIGFASGFRIWTPYYSHTLLLQLKLTTIFYIIWRCWRIVQNTNLNKMVQNDNIKSNLEFDF